MEMLRLNYSVIVALLDTAAYSDLCEIINRLFLIDICRISPKPKAKTIIETTAF